MDIKQVLLFHCWNVRFLNFCRQIEWKIVRWWHHQLTYLHIGLYMYRYVHIKCSRNGLWQIAKLYNFIYSWFLIQFSMLCLIFFYSFYWINFYLDWINPLNFIPQGPFSSVVYSGIHWNNLKLCGDSFHFQCTFEIIWHPNFASIKDYWRWYWSWARGTISPQSIQVFSY